MSFSIDGKEWKGNVNVKYGEPFPKQNRSIELENETFGRVLVYITNLGTPEWTEKMSVSIPIKYYITEIIKPSNNYQKKQQKKNIGLRLIK
ncbi:hypothetical protein LG329_19320 (plasmid) [Virgibacillus necropolis]|uniref:hypothetical protein n=1 Tax=Virgibacillus necropolis TaxID=163877 RepID=UPI0038517B22